MTSIDLERRFLVHLRAQADARRVTWSKLVEADAAGPSSSDWPRTNSMLK
jgi:predicted DNA-binding ribbon-helix-helix protein